MDEVYLKDFMDRHNLRQVQLAYLWSVLGDTNVAPGTVSRIMKGKLSLHPGWRATMALFDRLPLRDQKEIMDKIEADQPEGEIDPSDKFHNLQDANLASIAQEAVLRDIVQNGTADIVRVREAIGMACGENMGFIARAMHFAQRITAS